MLKIFHLNKITRSSSSFSRAKRGDFFQSAPKLANQFLEDAFLREQLNLEIPKEVYYLLSFLYFLFNIFEFKFKSLTVYSKYLNDIEQDLTEFGHKVATNIYDLHLECEKVVANLYLLFIFSMKNL